MGTWTGLISLRIETGGRFFKCGNEPSGSIEFVDFLN
jgi:hypothetical protein